MESSRLRGWRVFALVLLGLVLLDGGLAFVKFSPRVEPYAAVIVIAVYVAAPILGIYAASADRWTFKKAAGVLVAGLVVHLGLIFVLHPTSIPAQIVLFRFLAGFKDAGLLTWCLGLGGLLAMLMRDKNMLLPVAIFLAAFDVFVILTPGGPTRSLMVEHPAVFSAIAYSVPNAGAGMVAPSAAVAGRIGPADMCLLGMFFIALHRFGMRTVATLRAMIPALIGYLAIVLLFGNDRIGPVRLDMLPALVPIGLVIIVANRREFQMTKQEKLSTVIVACLGLGLIAFGATRGQQRRESLPGPLRSEPGQGAKESGGMRRQGRSGRSLFDIPSVPGDKPSPR